MAKPRVMFYHDGRHPHIYRYEPPMQKEEYVACIDELAGTPVDAVAFCLGEGRTMLHDTKAGELLGHNVDKWDHLTFRRAHQNAKYLIDEGNDPLRIVCERAQKWGIMVYPSLMLQLGGADWVPNRASNFRKENPQLEIGAAGDIDPNHPGFDGLDFKHKESRNERFSIIEEAVTDYPVNGFELQFNHKPYFFHPNEIESGRNIMTDWIGNIHELVKRSGSDREFAVRIPYRVEDCEQIGLDILEWIKLGIVDVLIGEHSEGMSAPIDSTCDFSELVSAAKGSKSRVLASLQSRVGSDRLGDAPISMFRAAACNYWNQGVDGLYLCQWFMHWPFQAPFYAALREIAYPEIMASKDKYYYIPTINDRPFRMKENQQLPAPMELNVATTVNWPVSDNLTKWDDVGRVHEVLIRIGVEGITELDQISFKLNGSELPPSKMRKINQMYRMSGPRNRRGPNYWFIFKPDREHWPIPGENRLDVTLLERDPEIESEVRLNDVEMEIKYLMGKSFHRDYVDPDLGPYGYGVS